MTLVHAETGEIVTAEPTSLVQVEQQCTSIERWAQATDSIPEIRDATNRLAAIDEYLARTSTEGRSRVAAAMRRLEVRIGELLPAQQGQRTDLFPDKKKSHGIATTQRHEFRQMAAHPEAVEEAIAASDDEHPASRSKVMQAIKQPTPAKRDRTREAVDARDREIVRLADEGHSSTQIARRVGLSAETVRAKARQYGFEITADRVIGRARLINPDRVVSETVYALDGLAMGVKLIDLADLDPAQVAEWATSMSASLSVLTRLAKQLKEMTRAEA